MKESDWTIFRTRYIPALWPIGEFWNWPVSKITGVPFTTISSVWVKGEYTAVRKTIDFDRLGNKVVALLKENFHRLQEIRKEGIESGKKVVSHCESFYKKSESASVEEFIPFMEKSNELYHEFQEKNMLWWVWSGRTLEQEARKELIAFDEQTISTILQTMSAPTIPSYSQQEEESFEKIVESARKKGLEDREVRKSIQSFSKQYYWFPYEYVGPTVWDDKAVTERVKESMQKPTTQKEEANVEEKQRKCIQQYQLPKKVVELFRIIQMMTLMQDDRKRWNAQACYYYNGVIMQSLAEKMGITLEEARHLDVELVKQYLKDEKAFRERLRKRMDFCAEMYSEKGGVYYDGKEGRERLKSLEIELEPEKKETSEIRGQPAFPGIVRGKVRVLQTSHVKDFQEGDIIVTGMTTPDFIVLMKKASAIITNEGGITSHAAIVSRELKKPCVIGTKIATQWVRDDDEVEVDATHGIVRIIRRSEAKGT